jgi:hypothetical protein
VSAASRLSIGAASITVARVTSTGRCSGSSTARAVRRRRRPRRGASNPPMTTISRTSSPA